MAWQLFLGARVITLVSVIFSLIGAFFVYLMGAKYIIDIMYSSWTYKGFSPRTLTADLLIAVDLFLFGSLLLIFSYGTYDLFLQKPPSESEPDKESTSLSGPLWLRIRTVEDLKSYLLGYILIMLSITFLKQAVAVDYTSPLSLFLFAGGIFLLGLTYYLTHKR